MQDLNDKITGDTLTAAEWNEVPSEIQNIIEDTGQTLSGADLNQLGKGTAQYVANGNFYTDSGSAGAYVLTQIGSKQVTTAYVDGMAVEFIAANTNAGASTVNVASLGVKNISDTASGGEIQSGVRISLRYNVGSGEFEISQTGLVPVTAGSIFGVGLSNAADTDHDITVAVGEAADSTNAFVLALTSAMTKQIDAIWAVGNNAGGLFTGTVAIDTWYHVFLIRKDSDGSIDAGFDTSVIAANIPSGYTAFRRIGSVLTDGSSNIFGFIQIDDNFIWDTPILDFSGAGSASRVNLTVSTPLGVSVLANFNYSSNPGAGNTYVAHPDTTDIAPSLTVAPLASQINGGDGAQRIGSNFSAYTNESSQVSHRGLDTSTFHMATVSWIDSRGQG